MRYVRPIRVLAAGALVATLAATVATAANAAPAPTGPAPKGPAPSSPAAGSPAPTSPVPGNPAPDDGTTCQPQDGIVVTKSMIADLAGADGHGSFTPSSGSFGSGPVGAGCGKNDEPDDGWERSGIPAPPDVNADADDENDPFDRQGGLYLGYQFDRIAGGLPDYWEQPIAFSSGNAVLIATAWPGMTGLAYTMTEYGWGDGSDARKTVQGREPEGPGCRWHGPVAATAMPGRVASYTGGSRPVYKYDHVPMKIGSRKFAHAPGGWFHYLCGAATPSNVSGPAEGRPLTGVEGDYYITPHWVYAVGLTADVLTRLAPVVRAARAMVTGTVATSPVNRSVVNLKTWMWSDARRYEFVAGGQRAVVVPTGIRVVAPGVPLKAHDLRSGGCLTGGVPDVGDKSAQTDCYLTFTKANSPDPSDVYRVGFALRWEIRVPGGRPLIFWTTRVQAFKVGEVQVPNN